VSAGDGGLPLYAFQLCPETSPAMGALISHSSPLWLWQKQTEVERQKTVAECKELRGFLEEKEQLLLSRLEELDRDIVKRRDESVSRLSEEIAQLDKLLGEHGGENGPGSTVRMGLRPSVLLPAVGGLMVPPSPCGAGIH